MYHHHYDRYQGSSQAHASIHALPPPQMMPTNKQLSAGLIARSISYHGLPLQKMWEGERGEHDLQEQGLLRPDYSMYQMRQKYLTFQDRAKRLRLHQFISKKADAVFDQSLVVTDSKNLEAFNALNDDAVVQIPPYEVFLNVDPYERTRHFFQSIQAGDIIYGSVVNVTKTQMFVKIICATGSVQRFVGDLGIKAMIPMANTVPVFNKLNDRYDINDYVCCEVFDLSPESQKIILTMKSAFAPRKDTPPFGLITTDNFPEVYKTASETKNLTYNEVLENHRTFKNPNSEDVLFQALGLDPKENYTNMTSLKGKFPTNEYASQIRQDQASKWAFRSVAEGIEHFKEGRCSEAFSCLNKALSIDPRNVEGLVARGALYANSGSFKKAVEDFEAALLINNTHANARKYLGETLVALGRSYEDENEYDEARKAYQDCLKVTPMHEEALNSLEYLRNKSQAKMIVPPTELVLPPLNLNKGKPEVSTKSQHSSRHHDKKRKEKSKKKRKRHDSSSSDGSSSSGSSSSSSRSSSSSSSSDRSSKKDKGQQRKKDPSSPFSAQMMKSGGNQFNQPFGNLNMNTETDDYESKVRQFLDMARADDDHEDKVRKLIEDAARYQEERKNLDSKSKKKKRKEEKKAKKEAKKKKKKDKKSKKSKLDLNEIENAKIREALKIFESLPVLDDLGAKLSEIYGVKTDIPAKTEQTFDDKKESKWKMSFQNKDDPRGGVAGPSKIQSRSNARPGKGLSPPDSDDDRGARNNSSSNKEQPKPKLQPQPRIPSPLKIYGRNMMTSQQSIALTPAPPVKSGPVVLDKFGNFRLANVEPMVEPLPMQTKSRSRSRSRSRSYNYNNRRRRSRSNSSDYRRRQKSRRSTSRDFYRRLAISRSRSRSPVRFNRGDRRPNKQYNSYHNNRSRSRSRSPLALSPIRATNPLGRPFGGGRGRGTGTVGRWVRGAGPRGRFNNRDRSASRSPKRYNATRKRDYHDDRTRNRRSRSKDDRKNDKPKTSRASETKTTAPIKNDNDDPPPPGTEDDVADVEQMLAQANKMRKEDIIKRNPDLLKNP